MKHNILPQKLIQFPSFLLSKEKKKVFLLQKEVPVIAGLLKDRYILFVFRMHWLFPGNACNPQMMMMMQDTTLVNALTVS